MKKVVTLICTAVCLIACLSLGSFAEKREITVYNWGQYIGTGEDGSIDVIAEFEKATGISVNYITFDSNETLLTKLQMGGSGYDVIIPSDYMIEMLIKKDMLEKLDFKNIPNYKNIPEAYRNKPYDPENEYSVPYTFGAVGIIYNTDFVKEKIDSWEALWNGKYSGNVLMFDNSRDAFAIAEARLGYSYNTKDEAELKACYELLLEQKNVLQGYVMDQIFDLLGSGEAVIGPYYAGDYMTMHADNPSLEFCYPKEGFNYFVDAMCIPKGSSHKAEAEAFINFMCDPEIAGRNADAIGYATPVEGAKAYLDEEWANSPVAYPDEETLKRSQMFLGLPPETAQYMDELWTKLKVNEKSEAPSPFKIVLWVLFFAALLAYVVYFIVRSYQKKALYKEDVPTKKPKK